MWLALLSFACAPDLPLGGATESCPALVRGDNAFTSAGLRRRVRVFFPESGIEPGMPVQYLFHGRHQRAEDMVNRGELPALAQDHGVITVAPDSHDRHGQAWIDTPDSRDLALFDDVTRCLVEGYGADADRVGVAGFSAGALFTTWLLLTRADVLSSAITFSGGVDDGLFPYETPAAPVPALVVWGGEGDTADAGDTTVYFDTLSRRLARLLRKDGHVVGTCDHGNGHRVPGATPEMLEAWSLAHTRGIPSPFPGAAAQLPDYCTFE